MRFHLDEHIAEAVANGLRQRGIDVTTTSEAKLIDSGDEDHLAHALREGRVIVTQDADFLRMHAAQQDHPGIVYFPQGSRTIGDVVRHLALMHDCLKQTDMHGQVEYL